MAKGNYIKFRCSDDFKDLVERQAKEYGMTVSSYIEHLIRKDVDVMRVVYNDFITDEMDKILNKKSGKLGLSGISIDDRDIEYLEWLLNQVDENSFDVAESIALLTKQAEDNQKKYETIMTGINKWRAGHSEISEAD